MSHAEKLDAFGTAERRWRALVDHDPAAGAAFLYAVRTTGVYCRPGCASRLPKRANVEFFDDRAAAERAGYRPCRRCRPDAAAPGADRAAMIARACRTIETAEETPSLAALAGEAGLSPWHFHRVFKEALGVTPRAYAASHRSGRFREALRRNGTVTEAIYDAGYGSSSRAYEAAGGSLGMTPAAYRRGGAGLAVRYATAPCALGRVAVAATERGICAIELADSASAAQERLRARFPAARLTRADGDMKALVEGVVALIDTPGTAPDLPLDIRGTAFQCRVWEALRRIAPGETATYAEVARRIGRPEAARAVAGACAANALAVAVPCHRVVRGDGAPGGYRWGVARKRELLRREGALAAGGAGE